MIDLLIYAAAFIVALGILVVVHEFGHYWVARVLGVKVLRFSVGFGKPLWQRRIGKDRMELVVAAVPLGGYVKMLDENEGPVSTRERRRAFNRQPVWKRMAIVLAGPFFNFLFAVLAYWLVFVVGVAGLKPVVGSVLPDSYAARAGFTAGDEILSIDGEPIVAWDQRRLYLFRKALAREKVEFQVRDASEKTFLRTLDLRDFPVTRVNATLLERGIGLIPYLPEVLRVVGAVEPGPARDAGMKVGDEIVAIDGQSMNSWKAVRDAISARPGETLRMTVLRDGQRLELQVIPSPVEINGKKIGRINVAPSLAPLPDTMRVQIAYGPLDALHEAAASTWSMSVLTVEMLYRMLLLEVSTKNISGPLTIAQYAGHSAQIGLIPFIMFLAVISISLGVINLLPIPILDGGHLLYYVVEAIKGSPVSERTLAWGQQFGIAVLIALMTLAFYNDITRLFH